MMRRGFVLAFALFAIPLAALLCFTLVGSTLNGAGFARQEQLDSQSFYMAESGLNVAFSLFAANNFSGQTHEPDGSATSTSSPDFLTNYGVPGLSLDSDGWYVWEWDVGDDPDDSFTRSGRAESYRFKIWFPASAPAGHYEILCEASFGSRRASQKLEGVVDSALNYSIFDNGDLADFTRSSHERLSGKVHANGDLYLRPYKTDGLEKNLLFLNIEIMDETNPLLEIFTDQLTAGGNIIRHRDIWDQSDDGGRVEVTNSSTGASAAMEGASDGASGQGSAYDSFHPDWTDTGSNGAVSRWDGAVADKTLGSKVVSAPSAQTFQPGGFYSSKASVTINSATSAPYIQDVSFYNEAEERLVQAKEIDLQGMAVAGAWPSNGLVYSDVPVRLVNGHNLSDDLSVASSTTIYVKGDFNKQFPTAAAKSAGVPQHRAVSLMTNDRIYRLTSDFDDKSGPDYPTLLELATGIGLPEASDPPLFPGDDDNTLEVNAAMIDGAPTNDVRAWVDDPDNATYYIPSTGINNAVLGSLNRKVKQIPSAGNVLKVAFPQSEDFLENLQNVKVRGTGSIGHLRTAHMARFDNSDASHLTTPWIVKSFYIPPDDQIDGQVGLDFRFDPNLASALGGLSAAPFAPKIAHKVRWTDLSE